MSTRIHLSPSVRLLSSRATATTIPRASSLDFSTLSTNCHSHPIKELTFPGRFLDFDLPGKRHGLGGKLSVLNAWSQEGSLQEVDNGLPVSFELEPIFSESQFDRTIAEAQQLEESVIIVWMASWCRKCIYLKPKLEKLAADYYQRVRFFRVDVNNVPHKLVSRAGVTLWKDGKKQGEVIGGHKAHIVINEVREMIENECVM